MNSNNKYCLKRVTERKNNVKILCIVLDGVGYITPNNNLTNELNKKSGLVPGEAFFLGNAVNSAYTPNLNNLFSGSLFRTLKTHGLAVGLPSDDDMGNSEVGHNALGSGRVFAQGAKLVNHAISTGQIFTSKAWNAVAKRPELKTDENTLHFCGLLSDGNVHSHIDHLFALIKGAKNEGIKKVRLHVLLDGRDVSPTSALEYVEKLNTLLADVNSATFDCRVASGGGRTFVTMDRYESDWSIVERGYNAHVLGEGRSFTSLIEAIETFRAEKNYYDQDLPPFVIHENNKPLGTVKDNDGFIFFNFRGDRAIEISRALTEKTFTAFQRKSLPKIHYAGMMQYDGDLKIPELFLVEPPLIENTMTELLSAAKVKQFACSETQKYGHVTYFWNGNKSEKFDSNFENYVEVPSDLAPFSERPWMKSAEIADEIIKQMRADTFEVGRINFANGDMVGHTGDFNATVLAMTAVDLAVGRIMKVAKETNTILVVTADHGNADEMFEIDKKTKQVVFDKSGLPKVKTSHTLSPVPFCIFNAEALGKSVTLRKNLKGEAGLANIASTLLELSGFEAPPFYEESLISFTSSEKQSLTDSASESKANYIGLHDYSANYMKRYELAMASLFFADIIAKLRSKSGCPWDKEQTFVSLRRFLIEEAYETANTVAKLETALSQKNSEAATLCVSEFKEELGDVLLQVFLNSQIASEEKLFNIADVLNKVTHKMIERHPHVFNLQANKLATAEEVKAQWEIIKEAEKKNSGLKTSPSLLGKSLEKKYLPTLNFGTEISKRARQLGFSWPTLSEVFSDVVSEVNELKHEIEQQNLPIEKIEDEVGDIIFALCNVVTFIKETQPAATHFDFDLIARAAIEKFVNRFLEMEKIMVENAHSLTEDEAKKLSLEKWNDLWKKAKERCYR